MIISKEDYLAQYEVKGVERRELMKQETEEFLSHYGVKGMKWGVRKDRNGVSRRTDREARKDAKEAARAKMFYGEGAGTRRKLINKSVEAKKKRDPSYAKAFDKHMEEQDLSRHASKAKSERKRKDTTQKTKQRAGYVARMLTGEMGTQAAFMAAAMAGAAYLNSDSGRAKLQTISRQVQNADNSRAYQNGADFLADYLKRNA